MRILKRLFGTLLMLVLASMVWFVAPASMHYRIQESYVFQAKNEPAKVRLAVMLPKTGPYQTVAGARVSWDGAQTRESRRFVDLLKLEGRVPRGGTKEATVAYDVILFQGRARWEDAVEDAQLQPQKDIESDQPVLVAQAARVAGGRSREDAYRIYQFTASYLSWRWWNQSGTNLNQSALKAYRTRTGVCGEFANLMTALCRAAGIPAQSIDGLDLPSYPPLWSATRVWSHPGVAHAWTEFHTPAGWEMADPSGAYLMPVKGLWFGRNNGSHLSYGEQGAHERTFGEMVAWAATDGQGLSSISDPNKFASGADTADVSITPRVTVKVTWNGRWFYLAAVVLCLVAWHLYERRRLRRRSNNAPAQPSAAPNAGSAAAPPASVS